MRKYLFLFLLSCLASLNSKAQGLDEQIKKAIVNKSTIPVELGVDEESDLNVLKIAASVIGDNDYKNRYNGYRIILETGTKSIFLPVKTAACNLLLKSASDPSFAIRKGFHESFQYFEKPAFSESFKAELTKLIRNEATVNKGLLLLAGFLGMKEEMAFIKEKYTKSDGKYPNEFTVNNPFNKISYAAGLALARMGDEDSNSIIFSSLDSLKDDEIVLNRLHDMAYIRNDRSIDILVKYLNSNEQLPAFTDGSYREPYSWRALHQLAGAVKDFPIKKAAIAYYSQQEIIEARAWVKSNRSTLLFDENKW